MCIRRIGKYVFIQTSGGCHGFDVNSIDSVWSLDGGGVGFTTLGMGPDDQPMRYAHINFVEFVKKLTGSEDFNIEAEEFLLSCFG